ncbi:MAG: ChbG/HpnK family deacetylase [Bdellovibrionota bacterium]
MRLLPLVNGRHRLGLWFNRVVRWLLPVQTTDTQSGTYAMTRRLAHAAFAVQLAPDFLFDLELSLTAVGHQMKEKDLPVRLLLSEEKSSVRVSRESWAILMELPRLSRRFRQGCYHRLAPGHAFTADDWGLSAGVNRGILMLAQAGVIRRVSLMPNTRWIEQDLSELKKVPGIELGIHFNLTYGRPLTGGLTENPGLRRFFLHWLSPLTRKSALKQAVREELSAQLARLRELGVKPVYFDGHHHAHLLPGLLGSVADIVRAAGIPRVRLPYDPALWWTPKFPLNLLSWLALGRVRRLGFEYLACFYPQGGDFLDQGMLRAKLARAKLGQISEIIVHPASPRGLEPFEYPDSYVHERVTEFQALRMLAHALAEPT